MKRVCTLRKVLRSLSKVLLEKLFYRSYIVAFIATQFLLFLSYLQPGDMLWNRNPKYLYKKKFGSSQILVQNQCPDFERTCSSKVSH